MAFIRKKGKSFYLVHNVRENGRVRQVHLACLGNRPRVNPEMIEQVQREHPELQIDWQGVRERATESFSPPFHDQEGLEELLREIRSLGQDLRELHFDQLRARLPQLAAELARELHSLQQAAAAVLHESASPPTSVSTSESEAEKAAG